MAKVVVWLIVIFVVLFALRLIGLRNARLRRGAQAGAARAPASEPMVRCVRCGVFLPRKEARAQGDGYACSAGSCAAKA
jgi:hypothetical protein